ncbi:hypothetical protein [Ornithobacterium rhinotracheale]|uniref:hypothetical protein n=1 Tax=Ornithobacterium rhinotracheale TaxID=28251 RepID=UPI0040353DF7
MDKFEFYDEKLNIIQHNLNPQMRVKVLNFEHRNFQRAGVSTLYDIFDFIYIKGNPFIFLVIEDKFDDIWENEDDINYNLIHSIIRRMGNWYKAQVLSGKINPPLNR